MTTYTAVPTVNTGDLWTAANHNTYVRDNLAYVLGGLELTLTNKSGGSRVIGDVVVIDPSNDEAFTVSVTQGDEDWIGVLTENIANNAAGRVAKAGKVTVNVYGAVTRGNYIRVSATTGAGEDAGTTPQAGSFARALTAHAGSTAGTVTAELLYAGHTAGARGFTAYNQAAASLTVGEVLVWGDGTIARGVKRTTFQQTRNVAGIAITSMSSGGSAEIGAVRGLEVDILVTGGSPQVGEWLISSTTAGYAKSSGGFSKPPGAIGVALTTMGGTSGSIKCMLDIDFYMTVVGGGDGYRFGGYTTGHVATCNKLTGSTETSSTVVGAALATARSGAAVGGSAAKGYISSGYNGVTSTSRDNFVVGTETTSAGTASVGNIETAGAANGTNFYGMNGQTGAPDDVAEKIVFSTDALSNLGSIMVYLRRGTSAFGSSDSSYAYSVGGVDTTPTAASTVARINWSTDTASASSNTMAAARGYTMAGYSTTHGFVSGGWASSALKATTEKGDFATETFSTLAAGGNLGTARARGGTMESIGATRGYVRGGSTTNSAAVTTYTGPVAVADKIDFGSDTASLVASADLATATTFSAAFGYSA